MPPHLMTQNGLPILVAFLIGAIVGCGSPSQSPTGESTQANRETSREESFLADSPLFKEHPDIATDLQKDIQIRPGMTVTELRSYVERNNQEAHSVTPPGATENKSHPPAFSYPELHLYVFSEITPHDARQSKTEFWPITYSVNGRHHCWMDIAIKNDVVQNIHVAPGNMSQILPPARWIGEGPHVGMLAAMGAANVGAPSDRPVGATVGSGPDK